MTIWQKLLPLNLQRKKLLKRYKNTALEFYLSKLIPGKSCLVKDTEFLVIDFETSGLNANTDDILSVGYTVIKNNRVVMSDNRYSVINQQVALNKDNVTIHQLTDSAIEQGEAIKDVFAQLLKDMAGRVLVAHNAAIERNFINKASLVLYGCELPVRIIDTLQIEKQSRQRRHQAIKTNELRLFNLRKNYGLPRYGAHNALEDAIATAELLLVQISRKCGSGHCKLKDLL